MLRLLCSVSCIVAPSSSGYFSHKISSLLASYFVVITNSFGRYSYLMVVLLRYFCGLPLPLQYEFAVNCFGPNLGHFLPISFCSVVGTFKFTGKQCIVKFTITVWYLFMCFAYSRSLFVRYCYDWSGYIEPAKWLLLL